MLRRAVQFPPVSIWKGGGLCHRDTHTHTHPTNLLVSSNPTFGRTDDDMTWTLHQKTTDMLTKSDTTHRPKFEVHRQNNHTHVNMWFTITHTYTHWPYENYSSSFTRSLFNRVWFRKYMWREWRRTICFDRPTNNPLAHFGLVLLLTIIIPSPRISIQNVYSFCIAFASTNHHHHSSQ